MAEPVRQPDPERAEGRKTWDPAKNKRGLESAIAAPVTSG